MLQKIIHYYKPYKLILLLVLMGSCFSALMELLFPYIVRQMLNVQIPQKNIDELLYWAGILLALYVVNFGLLFSINYYGHVMSSGIENDMRRDLFGHMEKMSFRFFDNARTGQLLSRITSDIVEISELTFKGPNDLLVCTISMLGTIFMMLYLNPYLGSIIGAMLIIKAVHSVFVNRKMKRAFRRSREKSGEVSAQAEEALSGIRLVKAFANEQLELERFMRKSNELLRVRTESFAILSYFSGTITFFTNATNLVVLVCGGMMVANDQLALSDFVAFFLYVNIFMKPVFRLLMFTEMYQRGMAGYHRFNEMMQHKVEIDDAPDAIAAGNIKGRVTFENVTFGYLQDKPVLKHFDLDIAPGEKVAFVGATGAGKTTLASLLLRFYEPTQGRVLLDGVDIRKYKQSYLRNHVGLVQQDVFLFSDSVNFNIAYGKIKASEQEIEQAAKLAAADDFISALPEGYETKVGERGVKLSGGQKQRISIARALAKHTPVLVLDDSTSALDMETEYAIQQTLTRLPHTTKLIIAHRISAVRHADEIIVLENGHIAERGTHEELLALHGLYYQTWQAQFGMMPDQKEVTDYGC